MLNPHTSSFSPEFIQPNPNLHFKNSNQNDNNNNNMYAASYFPPPVFGPHAFADPTHLAPMYSDPSPGFNGAFLL